MADPNALEHEGTLPLWVKELVYSTFPSLIRSEVHRELQRHDMPKKNGHAFETWAYRTAALALLAMVGTVLLMVLDMRESMARMEEKLTPIEESIEELKETQDALHPRTSQVGPGLPRGRQFLALGRDGELSQPWRHDTTYSYEEIRRPV